MRTTTTSLCAAAVALGLLGGGTDAAFAHAGADRAAGASSSGAGDTGSTDAELEAAYTALSKAQMRGASPAEVAALQARVRELEAARAARGDAPNQPGGVTATGVAPAKGGGIVVVPGADLPYFGAGGNQMKPIVQPPPPPPPDPSVAALVTRVHEGRVIGGDATLLLAEVMAYIGDDSLGFMVGYSRAGSDRGVDGLALSGSFFRFADAVRLFESGTTQLSLSMPAVDTLVGLYFPGGGQDIILRASVGLEFLGVRLATCLGTTALLVELRGPRVGISMFGPSGADPMGLLELGGSLAVGLTF